MYTARRSRLNILLPRHLHEALRTHARTEQVSISSLVELAVESLLSREESLAMDIVGRRIDRLRDRLARVARSSEITNESLALLMQYLLTVIPPLGETESLPARQLAARRFATFVAEVARRVSQGPRLVEEIDHVQTTGAAGEKQP